MIFTRLLAFKTSRVGRSHNMQLVVSIFLSIVLINPNMTRYPKLVHDARHDQARKKASKLANRALLASDVKVEVQESSTCATCGFPRHL